MTIYEDIGGQEALAAVVDDFYDRVLADPALTGSFAGVNLARLKGLQVEFFAVALGGPDEYGGRTMKEVHRGLGITRHQFDLVAGHLEGSLRTAGVPGETVPDIMAAVAPLAGDIVSAE
ncbi:group 1 truncated hemoglobin [Actinophytocola xinjiangensis]|uniref:Group 1 truncated hemoglobin n=1 Tax=Actinophytocola xinjiangensis TaxID=485602 RepID=A0A7Z1B0F4_9PSEU|nr:group 1 truncated hemoglobin [Actinophytocola xinjiangensis]OLF11992.1 group 1 truncated hemoglobin [Actinophytocola xinjiangensis]